MTAAAVAPRNLAADASKFCSSMPIELDMMLADAVAMQDGHPVIVRPGWMVRAPRAGLTAIAFVVRVPRDQRGKHQIRLELLDSDDQIVVIDPPDGPGPVILEEEFEANGLDDPNLTTPFSVAGGINLPPFPLGRGREYRWRAYVDGETRDSWTLPFRTTPPKPPRPPKPRSARPR